MQSKSPIEYRKATIADIPLIQDLARVSWQATYKEILSTLQIDYMLKTMYSDSILARELESSNVHYLILYSSQNTPIAFVGFEHAYEPQVTKLHRIYFLPQFQGVGLGTYVLNILKQKTRQQGDLKLILNVNKENRARFFYAKNGFEIYSEGVFDIGNGFFMDDYLMECYL